MKKNSFAICICIVSGLLLSGCAQRQPSVTQPNKACFQSCVHKRTQCQIRCRAEHEECVGGHALGIISKDNPSCQLNCGCVESRQACFVGCGGKTQ